MSQEQYDGNWENDTRCGQGRNIYKDGSVYEGEWFQNVRNGYGRMIWPWLDLEYRGNWLKGQRLDKTGFRSYRRQERLRAIPEDLDIEQVSEYAIKTRESDDSPNQLTDISLFPLEAPSFSASPSPKKKYKLSSHPNKIMEKLLFYNKTENE